MLSSAAHMNAPKEGIVFDNLAERKLQRLEFLRISKIANLLFAKELARRFSGTKKTAYAVHPG